MFNRFSLLRLLPVLLVAFLLAGHVLAQASGSVTPLGDPTVTGDQVSLDLVVKGPSGLPALNLTAQNFSLNEPVQNKQVTATPRLPIALAVIVDLSYGSDDDLIRDTLRAYFNHDYQPGDHVTFYVLGTNANQTLPDVSSPADLDAINKLINGLNASNRFYSISNALTESLAELQPLNKPDQPAHALYIGSFLNDPSEANDAAPFKLAGIPLHVIQAHRYRHPVTLDLQKLASEGGGLFADDQGGSSVLSDSTPVNLVKTLYDVIAASRTVYTLSYQSLNQSLQAQRSVTVTVNFSADESASANFTYQREFQPPQVTMVSASLTPVRLPTRQNGQITFDVARQPVTVSISFPDGITRKIASLRLEVVDGSGNTLQSTLASAPAPDASGNYVLNWPVDAFNQPGTTTAVNLKVTATDEIGLSGALIAKGSVTVGALPPEPTPTPLPTATPLPPTAVPTPVQAASSGVASLLAGSTGGNNLILIGVIAVLVVILLLLLIAFLRLRRQQAEREEELETLRDQPTPPPVPVETVPASNGRKRPSANGASEDEEEKTIYGRLIVLDGLDVPEIPIDQTEFVIGRRAESGCNYVIDQPFISPRHCMIISHDNGYAIRDLNTKNGTFVNGERISRDHDVVVPIGSEVGITERIKLELWDPHTVVNLETRRAGQTDAHTTTRVKTTNFGGDSLFQPLPGIRYADDDDSEIEDDYSPI